jgi:hypothetical protein
LRTIDLPIRKVAIETIKERTEVESSSDEEIKKKK